LDEQLSDQATRIINRRKTFLLTKKGDLKVHRQRRVKLTGAGEKHARAPKGWAQVTKA